MEKNLDTAPLPDPERLHGQIDNLAVNVAEGRGASPESDEDSEDEEE